MRTWEWKEENNNSQEGRWGKETRKRVEWSEAGTDISQFEIKKGQMEREWENLKISLDTKIWERVINKLQLK